ncbi:winged helix-turn-helix transcriptional regulator [candidate division KSB1 bacterium]|nr:winged helix-turn-helix transcriptional regulator [candidate division KSB1 bacterium]
MHADKLDAIDLKILELLQKAGRTKRNELAEEVKLSIPSISERMHKMEKAGVIKSYNAIVEARRVGLEVTAFVLVRVASIKEDSEVREYIMDSDEILECHTITGEGSYLLKVRTKSTESLERLLQQIQQWPGVTTTKTNVVLSSAKETTVLPLKYYKI